MIILRASLKWLSRCVLYNSCLICCLGYPYLIWEYLVKSWLLRLWSILIPVSLCKQQMVAQVVDSLPPMYDNPVEFPEPDFGLIQPNSCRNLRSKLMHESSLSLFHSLPPSLLPSLPPSLSSYFLVSPILSLCLSSKISKETFLIFSDFNRSNMIAIYQKGVRLHKGQ